MEREKVKYADFSEESGNDDRFSENNALIEQARSDNSALKEAAYDRLVRLNAGLVKSIALRYIGRGIDLEDLIQIGSIGLIKAIDGFDPSRGFAFSTYALPVINGEIRAQIRDTGPIKVSRMYKRYAAMLMHERNVILENEGRDAGIAELAERCGIEIEEASAAFDACQPVVSLQDQRYEEGDSTLMDGIECERANEEMCGMLDRVALSQEISALPTLWRKIVLLRYYRDKTQTECASLLGVTQVKISREEKKILAYLKKRLEG